MHIVSESYFDSINNNINGPPRYVSHWLALDDEQGQLSTRYTNAVYYCKKAINKGKKYNTKSYGGGIVIETWNLQKDIEKLNEYIQAKLRGV